MSLTYRKDGDTKWCENRLIMPDLTTFRVNYLAVDYFALKSAA